MVRMRICTSAIAGTDKAVAMPSGKNFFTAGFLDDDAEFIAHSRQDIPALLDVNDRLLAEIERLNAVISAVEAVAAVPDGEVAPAAAIVLRTVRSALAQAVPS